MGSETSLTLKLGFLSTVASILKPKLFKQIKKIKQLN